LIIEILSFEFCPQQARNGPSADVTDFLSSLLLGSKRGDVFSPFTCEEMFERTLTSSSEGHSVNPPKQGRDSNQNKIKTRVIWVSGWVRRQ